MRIAGIGQDVAFVFAGLWINQEIEAAIGILQLGNVIRFPFGDLHDVADAIATFWNAEIIEIGHAGERIDRGHQIMDQAGGVDGVFAVIAGVVVATGNTPLAIPREGIETAFEGAEVRRRLGRVIAPFTGTTVRAAAGASRAFRVVVAGKAAVVELN